MHSQSTINRFRQRVLAAGTADCWLWTGGISKGGYGRFFVRGKTWNAHRISWEIANGRAVPEGLIVRHTCDNRRCVNPSHLLIGTHKQNTGDAIERGRFKAIPPQPRRDHCGRGHPFTPENTIERGPKGRQCRACKKILDAQRYRRTRAAASSAPDEREGSIHTHFMMEV